MAQKDFLDKFTRSTKDNLPLGDARQILTIKFWKTAVVNPTGTFFFYWSMVNTMAVFYNNIFLALRGVFSQTRDRFHSVWTVFDILADIIFIVDMAIRSRKAFLEHGLLVQDVPRLLKTYLKSYMFFVDCVTIFPLQIFGGHLQTSDYKYRLNRALRIRRMVHFFHMSETRYPTFARLTNLLICIMILIHFNACIFFAICKQIGLGQDDWVYPAAYGDTELDPEVFNDVWQQYSYSFYWSTLTLTTIGDTPLPVTKYEMLYCIICSMLGVLLFATVFGNVGKLVNEMGSKRTEYQNKVESVKDYMNNKQIPAEMQAKIMKWFRYVWKHSQIADDSDILKQLPEKMQAEMGVCVHIDTLRNVKLFQDCEAGFLEELVLKLKLEVFSPGDFICRKGDIGREMYVIKRGYLHVLSDDGTVLAKLAEGQMFGEVSVLDIPGNVMSNRRLANVTAVGYVDLLTLSKKDIWTALEEYPAAKKILVEKGKSYLRRDKTKYIAPVKPTETGPDKRELLEQMQRESNENHALVQKRDKMLDEQMERQVKIKERLKRIEELLMKTVTVVASSEVANSVSVFTSIEIVEEGDDVLHESINDEEVDEEAAIKPESIGIPKKPKAKGQSEGHCKLQTSVSECDTKFLTGENEKPPKQDAAVSASIADLIENDMKVKESNPDSHRPEKVQNFASESNKTMWKNGTKTQMTRLGIAPKTVPYMVGGTEVTISKGSVHNCIPKTFVASRDAQLYKNKAGLIPTPVYSNTSNDPRPSTGTGWSISDTGRWIPRSKISQQSSENIGSGHDPITKLDTKSPTTVPSSTSGWAIGTRVKPDYDTIDENVIVFNPDLNTASSTRPDWSTGKPKFSQGTRTSPTTTAVTKHVRKDHGSTSKEDMPGPDDEQKTCFDDDFRKSTSKEKGDCKRHTKHEVGVQVQLNPPVNKAQPVPTSHRDTTWKTPNGSSRPDVRAHTSRGDKRTETCISYKNTGHCSEPENLDADFGHLVVET